MYFSLWHWAQMINGYSGHSPPGQVDFEVALKGFPDANAVDLLRARGATHVTINCALYRGGCDELLEPSMRCRRFAPWRRASGRARPVRLYELKR